MQNTHKNGHALKVVGTRNGRGPWIAALMLLSLAVVPAALSQNNPLTVLATFNRTNGADPQGNLTLIGSTLYGVTGYGGAHNAGAVFSMSRSGGSPTVVASFDGANGSGTWAGLTRKGTILYGTTGKGGLYGYGTVFSVPATGGNITVLASFNGVNGKTPMGGLTLSGNTLYGTTVFGGGAKELGTVFSVPTQGGKITVLASFNGTIEGSPSGDLVLSGNTLYGTTSDGGLYHRGTVFSVPITGGTPTVLANFNDATGRYPAGGLTLRGSTLYGNTCFGGANYGGTVFSVPTTGGNITVLASFSSANGQYPIGSLILNGSTLYGTIAGGGPVIPGAGFPETTTDSIYGGTVFSVPITGGTPIVLATFNVATGENAFANLILIGSTLYGTSNNGGANGYGIVFSVPTSGG